MATEQFDRLCNLLSGVSGGTQFASGATFVSGDRGTASLAVRQDSATALATNGSYTPLEVDASGRLWVNVGTITVGSTGKTVLATGGSASTSGNNTLIAADASNKIKVKAFSLTTTSTTAVTCIFQDGASGTELWRVVLQAASGTSTGANLATQAPDWLFASSVNTLMNLNLSAAQTVHWSLSYFKEP